LQDEPKITAKEAEEGGRMEMILNLKIYDLICTECGKPINKGTRVGCSCVFISQGIGSIKVMCPEHILEDEAKRVRAETLEAVKLEALKIAHKKKPNVLDFLEKLEAMREGKG
jgi:predicted nucleic acid-binding Zn ribbon protein